MRVAKPKNGIKNARDCPRAAELHTPRPEGYLEWHAWADEMTKTHRQERCPECGFLSIWTPKSSTSTTEGK